MEILDFDQLLPRAEQHKRNAQTVWNAKPVPTYEQALYADGQERIAQNLLELHRVESERRKRTTESSVKAHAQSKITLAQKNSERGEYDSSSDD